MIKGYCCLQDRFSKLFSGESLFPLLSLHIISVVVFLLMTQPDNESQLLKAEITSLGEVMGLTSYLRVLVYL